MDGIKTVHPANSTTDHALMTTAAVARFCPPISSRAPIRLRTISDATRAMIAGTPRKNKSVLRMEKANTTIAHRLVLRQLVYFRRWKFRLLLVPFMVAPFACSYVGGTERFEESLMEIWNLRFEI